MDTLQVVKLVVYRISIGAPHDRRPQHVTYLPIGKGGVAVLNVLCEFFDETVGCIWTGILSVLNPSGKMRHHLANKCRLLDV